jgi:hypothetical protein
MAYQVLLGLHNEMAAVYGIHSGSGIFRDAPPAGGEPTSRLLSMVGAGAHIYFGPPADPLIPYLVGGGGLLFHSEEDKYKGRGPAYFAGMGLKFAAPCSLEGRYLGGKTVDGDRSLVVNSFQLVFSLMVK